MDSIVYRPTEVHGLSTGRVFRERSIRQSNENTTTVSVTLSTADDVTYLLPANIFSSIYFTQNIRCAESCGIYLFITGGRATFGDP